jgi:excisionase family DNA binding protein
VDHSELIRRGAYTVTLASVYTSLSRSTLYALMQAGRLRYTKIGRRRLIPIADLEQLLAEGMVGKAPGPDAPPSGAP